MVPVSGATRLSVSLPSALVKEFDSVWRGMQYKNTSKAVHDAIRNFFSDHKWMQEEAEELMGAIVLLYYVNKPEIIGIKGNAKDAKSLAQKLMAKKGVKQLKFAAIIP